MKPDLTVKKYYDALDEGTILGRRCTDCGNVEFPPVYSCNECSGHHTEWVEMSGDAELYSVVAAKAGTAAISEFMPYGLGNIRMKEGGAITGIIRGVTVENQADILDKCPVPLKASVVKMPAGYSRIIFDLVTE